MKRNNRRIRARFLSFLFAALFLLAASPVFANAFFIQEMSGDGMAQGGAVVAGGRTPSAMFQNAANLSFLEGLHFQGVLTLYTAMASYENPAGETTNLDQRTLPVPHVFTSFKINDWLAVGLGEFTDFGLEVHWPKDWEGRHIVIDAGLQSFTINPNVSFGPFKGFAVAVGFDAKWGRIDIRRALTLGLNPADELDSPNTIYLNGSAWGFGGNLGLMYQPADWVRLGASYRSAIKMSLDNGRARFTVNDLNRGRFPDQGFSSSITLPHLVNFGARFWPMKNLSLELDVWGTFWSSYDKLVFKFDEGLEQGPDRRIMEQTETKDYEDFVQIRLGAEWLFLDHYALRAGIMLDGNVVPDKSVDPMLPDGHRINSCIGFGTEWYGFYADAAYMLVWMLARDVSGSAENPMPGKYQWVSHVVTLSVGYHFDPFAVGKDEPKGETVEAVEAASELPADLPAPPAEDAPVPETTTPGPSPEPAPSTPAI